MRSLKCCLYPEVVIQNVPKLIMNPNLAKEFKKKDVVLLTVFGLFYKSSDQKFIKKKPPKTQNCRVTVFNPDILRQKYSTGYELWKIKFHSFIIFCHKQFFSCMMSWGIGGLNFLQELLLNFIWSHIIFCLHIAFQHLLSIKSIKYWNYIDMKVQVILVFVFFLFLILQKLFSCYKSLRCWIFFSFFWWFISWYLWGVR